MEQLGSSSTRTFVGLATSDCKVASFLIELCELVFLEVGHQASLVLLQGGFRDEISDTDKFQELKEVSFSLQLLLRSLVTLQPLLSLLVKLLFLAAARAQAFKYASEHILRVEILVSPLGLQTLLQVLDRSIVILRFISSLHP